jgi:hypothetical protein
MQSKARQEKKKMKPKPITLRMMLDIIKMILLILGIIGFILAFFIQLIEGVTEHLLIIESILFILWAEIINIRQKLK